MFCEVFREFSAEYQIKKIVSKRFVWLIYPQTIQGQRVFSTENRNIGYIIRKIVSKDLQIQMETSLLFEENIVCVGQNEFSCS